MFFVAGVGGSSKEQQWIYCGKWRPVHGVGWQKLFKSFHISHFSVQAAKFFIRFVSQEVDDKTSTTYSSKIKSFQLRVRFLSFSISRATCSTQSGLWGITATLLSRCMYKVYKSLLNKHTGGSSSSGGDWPKTHLILWKPRPEIFPLRESWSVCLGGELYVHFSSIPLPNSTAVPPNLFNNTFLLFSVVFHYHHQSCVFTE